MASVANSYGYPNVDIYGGGTCLPPHNQNLIAHGQQVELLSFDFDENRYAKLWVKNCLPKLRCICWATVKLLRQPAVLGV
jgi:hypothetical protein